MSQQVPRLKTDSTVLLVIDVQQRLLPAMHDAAGCLASAVKLAEAARVLGVPALATEQYPAGLGPTCAELRSALGDAPIEQKMLFSAYVEGISRRLAQRTPAAVIVAGIEAHVCVQQTVLDLLRAGYQPYVCADATSSRRPIDRETALARMRQAGAVVTTVESVIFELLGEAGTERFRQILKIVK